MPITDYPFVIHHGIPRPLLPVVLENPVGGRSCKTWALIDTGADSSAIPGFLAKELCHDITHEDVRKESCHGVGGAAFTYFHSFRLSVLGLDSNGETTEDVSIRINKREFGVAPDLHIMLLGVSDFLAKYLLSVNYPKKLFSVNSR